MTKLDGVNFWLLKTDPSDYSFQQMARASGKIPWDGVRQPLALTHLRGMRKCDQALIYHSGTDRAVVGTVRIASNPYPDISNDDARLLVVDVDMPTALIHPVSLARLRHDERFASLLLLKSPNLNVMPVAAELFTAVLELGQAHGPA